MRISTGSVTQRFIIANMNFLQVGGKIKSFPWDFGCQTWPYDKYYLRFIQVNVIYPFDTRSVLLFGAWDLEFNWWTRSQVSANWNIKYNLMITPPNMKIYRHFPWSTVSQELELENGTHETICVHKPIYKLSPDPLMGHLPFMHEVWICVWHT